MAEYAHSTSGSTGCGFAEMAPRQRRPAASGAAPRPRPRPRLVLPLFALALMACSTLPLTAAASKGGGAAASFAKPWVGRLIGDPFEDIGGLKELQSPSDHRAHLEESCDRWRREMGPQRGGLCPDISAGRFSRALRGFARWLSDAPDEMPEDQARTLLAMTINAAAAAVHDDGQDDEARDLLAGTDDQVRGLHRARLCDDRLLPCCLPASLRPPRF